MQMHRMMMMMILMMIGELLRLREEMASAADRAERQKEALQQKLTAMDNDQQMSLQQVKRAHEQDVARLNQIKACCRVLLLFSPSPLPLLPAWFPHAAVCWTASMKRIRLTSYTKRIDRNSQIRTDLRSDVRNDLKRIKNEVESLIS